MVDPHARYTAKQALLHPFITDNCGFPVEAKDDLKIGSTEAQGKQRNDHIEKIDTNLAGTIGPNLQKSQSLKQVC